MTEDDKYMDDQFKRASEDLKFPYQSSFWDEVESQLADESLDSAFKSASANVVFMPQMDLSESIDDAFLDESFKSAATNLATDYKPSYWEQFQADLPLIQQDEAFLHASNSTVTPYQPHYWSDADVALQNEGLHYEYKSAYWNEARQMLDKADRGNFFFKWSAVAAILLLLSFGGIYQTSGDEQLVTNGTNISTKENSFIAGLNENHSAENLISFLNEKDISDILSSDPDINNNGENNFANVESNQINSAQNSINPNVTIEQKNKLDHNFISNAIPVLSINDEPILSSQFEANSIGLNHNTINQNNLIDPNSGQINIDNNQLSNNQNLANNTLNNQQVQNQILNLGTFNKLSVEAISKIENEINPAYERPEIKIEKFILDPTHTLSFIGQAGLGNKYGTVEFTPSWRTAFGFEYLNSTHGRLRNFEFGGTLSMNHTRQNDFGTERRVSVFQNDGGIEKFWYKLQIKDMMYANASVICNYKISQNHKLKLSLGVDYLVFVQSNMSYQVEADHGITTVNNNWGVKDGLNKIDARIGVGYEWQFSNRFALQANASYGLFDRTDNTFMMNTISDHEMNITVGLKYTLFRKI